MGGKLNEFVMTEEGLAKEVSEGGAEIKGLVDPTCEIDMAREVRNVTVQLVASLQS